MFYWTKTFLLLVISIAAADKSVRIPAADRGLVEGMLKKIFFFTYYCLANDSFIKRFLLALFAAFNESKDSGLIRKAADIINNQTSRQKWDSNFIAGLVAGSLVKNKKSSETPTQEKKLFKPQLPEEFKKKESVETGTPQNNRSQISAKQTEPSQVKSDAPKDEKSVTEREATPEVIDLDLPELIDLDLPEVIDLNPPEFGEVVEEPQSKQDKPTIEKDVAVEESEEHEEISISSVEARIAAALQKVKPLQSTRTPQQNDALRRLAGLGRPPKMKLYKSDKNQPR